MLTSTRSDTKVTAGADDASSEASPSYENIVGSVESTLSKSQPGDVLYLQFSGYIQRVTTATPHIRNLPQNDQDLALLPVNQFRDGRCLHDVELAALLYRLTAKGCEVMLVVDGRSTFLPELVPHCLPNISHEDTLLVSYGPWPEFGKHTWLQNPPPDAPYALLLMGGYDAISGSVEYREPPTQHDYGFLTYRLLKLLRGSSLNRTYRSFIRQLVTGVKPWFRHCTNWEFGLVLVSEMDSIFLGGGRRLLPLPPNFPAMVIKEQGRVEIQIQGGAAHGLRKGDRLVLVQGNGLRRASEFSQDGQVFGVLEVSSAHALFSHCRPLTEMMVYPPSTANESLSAILIVDTDSLPLRGGTLNTKLQATSKKPPRLTIRSVSDVNPMSPQMQVDFYRSLLHLNPRSSAVSRHVKLSVVGGYGHRQDRTPRVPTFGPKGHLHLLSGDYVVLHLISRLPRSMFVRILCFDSAFGVAQVYPAAGIALGVPSFGDGRPELPVFSTGYKGELAIHMRLSSPISRKVSTVAKPTVERLKVFVVDSPSSFEGVEIPPVSDEDFLLENQEAASLISGTSVDDDKLNSQATLADQPCNQEDESADDNWCCFEASFIVHKSMSTIPL
ncbi:hypothetical protein HRG_014446 [Hirsutella rhossiliensis]